jgi:hypothetical protein
LQNPTLKGNWACLCGYNRPHHFHPAHLQLLKLLALLPVGLMLNDTENLLERSHCHDKLLRQETKLKQGIEVTEVTIVKP